MCEINFEGLVLDDHCGAASAGARSQLGSVVPLQSGVHAGLRAEGALRWCAWAGATGARVQYHRVGPIGARVP